MTPYFSNFRFSPLDMTGKKTFFSYWQKVFVVVVQIPNSNNKLFRKYTR